MERGRSCLPRRASLRGSNPQTTSRSRRTSRSASRLFSVSLAREQHSAALASSRHGGKRVRRVENLAWSFLSRGHRDGVGAASPYTGCPGGNAIRAILSRRCLRWLDECFRDWSEMGVALLPGDVGHGGSEFCPDDTLFSLPQIARWHGGGWRVSREQEGAVTVALLTSSPFLFFPCSTLIIYLFFYSSFLFICFFDRRYCLFYHCSSRRTRVPCRRPSRRRSSYRT